MENNRDSSSFSFNIPIYINSKRNDEIALIQMLLRDIDRLPVIKFRRQQLWLGSQINGVQSLEQWMCTFQKESNQSPTLQENLIWVYNRFLKLWKELKKHATKADFILPTLKGIINEILISRHDLFNIHRSRIQRLFNKIEHIDNDEVMGIAYDLIEMLWLIPDSGLNYINSYSQDQYLPMSEDFQNWIAKEGCLRGEFEEVLAQKSVSRNWLIIGYLRYPVKIAQNFIGQGLEYLDLVQAGILGTIHAANNYNYREHDVYARYMSTWVWQRISRSIANEGSLVRVPVHFQGKISKVEEAYFRFTFKSVMKPTAHQLALQSELLSSDSKKTIHESLQKGVEPPDDVKEKWDSAAETVYLALSQMWPIHSLHETLPNYLASEFAQERFGCGNRKFPKSLLSYVEQKDHNSLFQNFIPKEEKNTYTKLLDNWLNNISVGTGKGKDTRKGIRREQLKVIFLKYGLPMHYAEVTGDLNDQLVDGDYNQDYVYSLLKKYDDIFILLGQGVFSMVEWGRDKVREKQPLISYCPKPFNRANATSIFFESVFVGREILEESLSAKEFLVQIIDRYGKNLDQPEWLYQSYITAYYLIGLIPYIFYIDNWRQRLHCTLPPGNVHVIRQYSLHAMNRRLIAMPIFWWYLKQYQPINVTNLGDMFIDGNPAGLDDVRNRLSILESIGALQKSQDGRFRLTDLGWEFASRYSEAPDTLEEEIDTTAQDIEDFDAFDLISF